MDKVREQEKFFAEYPGLDALSMKVVNEWGKGEKLLPHVIGQALLAAYQRGQSGEPLAEPPPPPPTVFRRTRPEPPAPPARNVFRRSR